MSGEFGAARLGFSKYALILAISNEKTGFQGPKFSVLRPPPPLEFLTCGLAGERRCAEKARATVEETRPLCMLEQLCARALPKVPEREIERRRTSEGCRKAPGTGRLPAPPHTCVGEDRIGIQGGGKSWIFISEKSIY